MESVENLKSPDAPNIWKFDIIVIEEILYELSDMGIKTSVSKYYLDKYDNLIPLKEIEIYEEYNPVIRIWMSFSEYNDIDLNVYNDVLDNITTYTNINPSIKSGHNQKEWILKIDDKLSFNIKELFKYYKIDSEYDDEGNPIITWDYDKLYSVIDFKGLELAKYRNEEIINAILNYDMDYYIKYFSEYNSYIEDKYLYEILSDENKNALHSFLNTSKLDEILKSDIFSKIKNEYEEIYRYDLAQINFDADTENFKYEVLDKLENELDLDFFDNNGDLDFTMNDELITYFNAYSKDYKNFSELLEEYIIEYFELEFKPLYEDWVEIEDEYFNDNVSELFKRL